MLGAWLIKFLFCRTRGKNLKNKLDAIWGCRKYKIENASSPKLIAGASKDVFPSNLDGEST